MIRYLLKERIVKLLERGPLYLGALPLYVAATEREVRGAVAELRQEGRVTVNGMGTVKLSDG